MRSPVPESRYIARRVGDEQHRLEPAQRAIGAPVARQLDRGALEIAAVLFELALEAAEQREAVGRRAGKSRQHAVVVQAPHLARLVFDDGLAERDLAVAGHHDFALWRRPSTVVAWGLGHGGVKNDPELHRSAVRRARARLEDSTRPRPCASVGIYAA